MTRDQSKSNTKSKVGSGTRQRTALTSGPLPSAQLLSTSEQASRRPPNWAHKTPCQQQAARGQPPPPVPLYNFAPASSLSHKTNTNHSLLKKSLPQTSNFFANIRNGGNIEAQVLRRGNDGHRCRLVDGRENRRCGGSCACADPDVRRVGVRACSRSCCIDCSCFWTPLALI